MTRADVEKLSLEERASLTLGSGAWRSRAISGHGIRGILFSDGPHGVRKPNEGNESSLFESVPATCFPTAAALGSSWNRALLNEIGAALGGEAASSGVDVLLAPGLNLKRSPLGGRNFEYFSEDPMLTATLGAHYVTGLQSSGVGASVKHFVANDTEDRRYGIDVRVDERALRELYLTAFEEPIVGAKPATVMAAYSKLNGTHCTENGWLLTTLLREEWGFDGAVISDWGASWDRALSVPAGLDIEMPGIGDSRALVDAVKRGVVRPAAVTRAAERIMTLAARIPAKAHAFSEDLHHELAARAAAEGAVLLQNTGGLLPLDGAASTSIAVFGGFAADPRYQGAGSSHVEPTRLTTVLGSLRDRFGESVVRFAEGYGPSDDVDPARIAEAQALAGQVDVAIVVVGLPESYETEGVDRPHLELPPSHNALVQAVAAANPRTVVVLQNGSPVEMPWRDLVPSILETHLGGQAGGIATVDMLFGDREPSGRLAETFPRSLADHPVAHIVAGQTQLEYWESLYVGYRYFDTAHADVAFPFGYGLSYSSFEWSELTIDPSSALSDADIAIRCSLTVTNVGDRRGSEVVQLYVHAADAGTVFRPEQELRAFEKVDLEPGETAIVRFELDRRAFAFWDIENHAWIVETGRYEIRAAASSRDPRSMVSVDISGHEPRVPSLANAAYDSLDARHVFTRQSFAALYGPDLPENKNVIPGKYTLDTSLRDMTASAVARGLFGVVRKQATTTLGIPDTGDVSKIVDAVVGQFTLRMLPTISNGTLSKPIARRMLWLINLTTRTRRTHHH
jgi:beta-glucosidase